jgi:myo-inositol-1(or 4)-monophosphatase
MNAPEASQRNHEHTRDAHATPNASPAERRALLGSCVAAAVAAGRVIGARASSRNELTWENKARSDFVSAVDREAEETIRELLHAGHADATLVGEELSPDALTPGGLAFVFDPLDGTTNFLHGFPWYAVSVAAMVDGVLAAGAVLNAATGELFTATAGGGARRGGQPIRVSAITDPERALIGTGMPFREGENVERYVAMLPEIMRGSAGIRRAGAAALDLADVACGRFEAFWELRLAPWDIAAGVLLVREAGGIVTTLDGDACPVAHTSVLAGNPRTHAWMLDRVKYR